MYFSKTQSHFFQHSGTKVENIPFPLLCMVDAFGDLNFWLFFSKTETTPESKPSYGEKDTGDSCLVVKAKLSVQKEIDILSLEFVTLTCLPY